MLKKAYTFIDNHIRNSIALDLTVFIITMIAMFLFAMLCGVIDLEPAKNADYEPLIEQKNEIVAEFEAIYKYDNYSISPVDDKVIVTLENDECSLVCSFTKQLELVDTEQIDNRDSIWEAIAISIIFALYISTITTWILAIALPCVLSLLLKLLEKIFKFLIQGGLHHGNKV